MNKYHELVKNFLYTMEKNEYFKVGYYTTDKKSAPSRYPCDEVTKKDVGNKKPLWLGFIYDLSDINYHALWIDMRTGEMDINGMKIGKIDSDIVKMLLLYYNDFYLYKWEGLYEDDRVSEGVVGIRNDFFCLARQVMRGYEKGTILYKCAMPRNLLDKVDFDFGRRLKLFTHKIADGITVEDIILD